MVTKIASFLLEAAFSGNSRLPANALPAPRTPKKHASTTPNVAKLKNGTYFFPTRTGYNFCVMLIPALDTTNSTIYIAVSAKPFLCTVFRCARRLRLRLCSHYLWQGCVLLAVSAKERSTRSADRQRPPIAKRSPFRRTARARRTAESPPSRAYRTPPRTRAERVDADTIIRAETHFTAAFHRRHFGDRGEACNQ